MEHPKVKVVDEFRVAPPPGSLPATLSLPLTFFDLRLLTTTETYIMRRLFFYAHPDQSLQHSAIALLKSSLSMTLGYFYTLVSDLIQPPAPQKPYFLFTEGNSVSFTVAQYSGDNHDAFDNFISHHEMKDLNDLHAFAPRSFPPSRVSPDGTRVDSLFSIQVTLFPSQGFCIGISFRHVALDGTALTHFIKCWSSICKSNGSVVDDQLLMPSFNRDTIKDPYKIESKLLQKSHDIDWSASQGREPITYTEKVRSTFVMKRSEIEKLKRYWLSNDNEIVHLSSFVVASSFICVGVIKSLESTSDDDDEIFHVRVPADCRNRGGFQLPKTYFGNCVVHSIAVVKKSELAEHNWFLVAARAIGKCIKALESSDGVLKAMEKSIATGNQLEPVHPLIIAASHRISYHKTDFGWGFPKKVESLHLNRDAISMAACRDEEAGGIEFSLELKRAEMETFTQLYYKGLWDSLL